MDRPAPELHGSNKWLVFGAVSLAFFFLNLATFTTLGVVLYSMVGELHWSMTAAGFSFTLLGIACGLSSPLPAITMKWVGGRITLCLGAVLLVIGFYLASVTSTILVFYLAMGFLGLGYGFAGNVPGVFLLSGWFGRRSAPIIGLYLMLGALGAAFGPPIVEAIVTSGAGWRGNWQVMAVSAVVLGLVSFVFVRDAGLDPPAAADGPVEAGHGHSPAEAVLTSQFLLVAASMAATMACVTTNSSVVVSHLVRLGATPDGAAYVLSALALTATLVKAISGRLCELVPAATILAAGLVMQAAGTALLAVASTPLLQYGSAITFGTGWGLAYVAGTVVLLEYFGGPTGSKILSIVWLLTTVAAAGPLAAGIIADRYGTFAPIYFAYTVMLLLLSVPIFLMRAPKDRSGRSSQRPQPALAGKVEAV